MEIQCASRDNWVSRIIIIGGFEIFQEYSYTLGLYMNHTLMNVISSLSLFPVASRQRIFRLKIHHS